MIKLTFCAAAAVATLTGLAALQPAQALPITATGNILLAPQGPSTVNTKNIAANTSTKTDPAQTVTYVDGTFTAGISVGDTGTFGGQPITVPQPPNGTTVGISPFTLTIHGITFTFDTGSTASIIATKPATGTAGFINSEYFGTITNGGGVFNTGTAITMSETCTQPTIGGAVGKITCTDALLSSAQIPEPASLAILGASLFGFGLLRRRRTV
jgi:hypothetical protein